MLLWKDLILLQVKLCIIDSDFTVDIDDSIAAIIESTKNENILINCAAQLSQWKKMQ